MRIRPALAVAGATLALAAPASAQAGDPIMPLSEVRAGMECTGLSVVRGTEIASFDVEVVDVVAGQQGAPAARILVRVGGPAIEATGIGPGFSGSPVYCADGAGTSRVIGALAEAIGEFGNEVVLATPIEEILGETPTPPTGASRDARMLRRARPLAAPLTVAGLHPALARRLPPAGARAGRTLLASPPGPLGTFAPQQLRPGAAVAVGLTSGDLGLGAIGTVAYADGDAVWAFGHPFDGTGPRSLLLQDAYVYTVIGNPFGVEPAFTYKLASPGHDIGTLTNDAAGAVVGRVGALPRTIPIKVVAQDLDSGRVSVVELRAADEAPLGLPSASSALSLATPLAVAQAGTQALRGVPSRVTASLCLRIELEERERPIRFCNRYVAGGSADADAGGLGAPMTDAANAIGFLDAFNFGPLRVTSVEVNLKLRRGLRQGYLTRVSAPRRVRRGQRVPVTVTVRRVNGPSQRRRFRLRIPRSSPTGLVELELAGTATDLFTDEIIIDFDELLSEGTDEDFDPGEPGPRDVDELAAEIESLRRYDGVAARFGRPGRRSGRALVRRALRDRGIRISGRASTLIRVVR
ncbi:MAG: hypothetical protein WD844_13010 [Thermoleophilaceae bacterium]